jgi:two-component system, OmpR family, alkaline phosphatase synthesis response regulator PhoP
MKILFADDDPIMLDTLQVCVTTEGFDIVTASDGEEAFAQWNRHHPALLCLDIMMPKLDGYEVCRRVRTIDPQVPILFLSAKSEEIDIVVGLQLGADDFIRKPFGKHELIARTLDQHIAKLRKRIETNPDRPLIETVRGVGYRFRVSEVGPK